MWKQEMDIYGYLFVLAGWWLQIIGVDCGIDFADYRYSTIWWGCMVVVILWKITNNGYYYKRPCEIECKCYRGSEAVDG